jgi:hypothetical protein
MKRKLLRKSTCIFLSLALISLAVSGCQKKEAPPPPAPAQTAVPPAPASQAAPQSMPAQAPAAPAGAPVQNTGQIQIGMTGEQVQQIMGAPSKIENEGSVVEWKYYSQAGKIEVKLQNNKVIAVEKY